MPTNGLAAVQDYVLPDICVGEWEIPACSDTYQEEIAASNLNASGAPLNVFKLLGVHEQGVLADLVGRGRPMNGTENAFDLIAGNWSSTETGMGVLESAWIGYDFGTTKTSFNQEVSAQGFPNSTHITSFRMLQPTEGKRALQVRIDRSLGGFKIDPLKVLFSGVGNGTFKDYAPGTSACEGAFILQANSATNFTVFFSSVGAALEVVGVCIVGVRFNSLHGSFTISPGSVPFSTNDMFTLPVELSWLRVDVINLPDNNSAEVIRINQSAASRYWRIVPISFTGVHNDQPWEVQKLELFDFQATRLDDVQDQLYLENRDRDYAKQSIQFKVSYQPFDSISDLSKFGFQISDMYTFTTVFSTMVAALGRPIVVGDILELPSELQYDHNLKPVRKFLEVTDSSWSADGFTTSWRPIIYKFQATQLIPSQENRDIVGTSETQRYVIDDGSFFDGIEQIATGVNAASNAVQSEALLAVPAKGTNVREVASGMNRFDQPGSYDGVGLYVEDGMPPDGQPYTEGFKLPDVAGLTDGEFFRLNYDPKLNIAARLYRFNTVKNRWIYIETDRRAVNTALKPSQKEIFNSTSVLSLSSTKI